MRMPAGNSFDFVEELDDVREERRISALSEKAISEMGQSKCKCGTVLNWKNKSGLCLKCERQALILSMFGQTPQTKIRKINPGPARQGFVQKNLFESKQEKPVPVAKIEKPEQVIEKRTGNAGVTPVMRIMGVATKLYNTTAKAVRANGRGYGVVDEARPVIALALKQLGMRPEEIKKFLGITVNIAPLLARGKRAAEYDLRAQKILSEAEKLA